MMNYGAAGAAGVIQKLLEALRGGAGGGDVRNPNLSLRGPSTPDDLGAMLPSRGVVPPAGRPGGKKIVQNLLSSKFMAPSVPDRMPQVAGPVPGPMPQVAGPDVERGKWHASDVGSAAPNPMAPQGPDVLIEPQPGQMGPEISPEDTGDAEIWKTAMDNPDILAQAASGKIGSAQLLALLRARAAEKGGGLSNDTFSNPG